MRPTDLPEAREKMLAWYASEPGLRFWNDANTRHGFLNDSTASPDDCADALKREMAAWRRADLFYVSEDMTALTREAVKSMPGFTLRPDDLPSPFGVMYFAEPIGGVDVHDPANVDGKQPIVAASWYPIATYDPTLKYSHQPTDLDRETRQQIWFSFYSSTRAFVERVRVAKGLGDAEMTRLRAAFPHPFMYEAEWLLPLGRHTFKAEELAELKADHRGVWPFTVRCAWLLMMQTVSSVTVERPDRPARRRLAKIGVIDPAPVRVVTLRHRGPERTPGETDREYRHRWMVKGHWRNHWYPKQERHIPRYINPHMKGPDGAPILGGEKVYAWTR